MLAPSDPDSPGGAPPKQNSLSERMLLRVTETTSAEQVRPRSPPAPKLHSARSPRSPKARTCPWPTACAARPPAAQLLHVVEEHSAQLDPYVTTVALQHLHDLCTHKPQDQRGDAAARPAAPSTPATALHALARLLSRLAHLGGGGGGARCAVNVAHAATAARVAARVAGPALQRRAKPHAPLAAPEPAPSAAPPQPAAASPAEAEQLLQAACRDLRAVLLATRAGLPVAKPHELAWVAQALGYLRLRVDAAWAARFVKACQAHMPDMDGYELCMVAWALAKAQDTQQQQQREQQEEAAGGWGAPDAYWLSCLTSATLPHLAALEPVPLANLLWAVAEWRFDPGALAEWLCPACAALGAWGQASRGVAVVCRLKGGALLLCGAAWWAGRGSVGQGGCRRKDGELGSRCLPSFAGEEWLSAAQAAVLAAVPRMRSDSLAASLHAVRWLRRGAEAPRLMQASVRRAVELRDGMTPTQDVQVSLSLPAPPLSRSRSLCLSLARLASPVTRPEQTCHTTTSPHHLAPRTTPPLSCRTAHQGSAGVRGLRHMRRRRSRLCCPCLPTGAGAHGVVRHGPLPRRAGHAAAGGRHARAPARLRRLGAVRRGAVARPPGLPAGQGAPGRPAPAASP